MNPAYAAMMQKEVEAMQAAMPRVVERGGEQFSRLPNDPRFRRQRRQQQLVAGEFGPDVEASSIIPSEEPPDMAWNGWFARLDFKTIAIGALIGYILLKK